MGAAVVVGGGTAGLAAATVLRLAGVEPVVIEKRGFPGGRIASMRRDGFTLDLGAQFLFSRYPATFAMADRLGARGEVVRFRPWLGVARDGRLHTLSMDPLEDLRHPARVFRARRLLSPRGRLAAAKFLLALPLLRRKLDFDDPGKALDLDAVSFTDYVRERFGEELLEYVAQPIASTLTLGMPEEISAAHGLALAWYMPPGLFTFKKGIGFLADRMSGELSDLRLETAATRIVVEGNKVRGVEFLRDGGKESIEADSVVCATTANIAADLLGCLPGVTGRLREVRYSACMHVMLAVEGSPFGDVFAIATPRREGYTFSGLTENSRKAPGYAPRGHSIVHVYTYDRYSREMLSLPAAEVVKGIVGELRRLAPSFPAGQLFSETLAWPEALCLTRPGHAANVAAIGRELPRYRGLYLAGEYFGTPSAEAAIHSGVRAAERLLYERA